MRLTGSRSVYGFVLASGFAALSWEVLWQLKSSLSLGISALGTAITLATTMFGMSLGAMLASRGLSRLSSVRPLIVYAWLEAAIGLAGLGLAPGFRLLEHLDAEVYSGSGLTATAWLHGLGIAALLGIPTACMGATIPLYGLIGRASGASIAALYGLNTFGAAVGCLLLAFLVVPTFGVQQSIYLTAGLNFGVCLLAFWQGTRQAAVPVAIESERPSGRVSPTDIGLAFLTGFSTLCLEVAWFRAMKGALQSTTDSFAIMLASVLLSLALGAHFGRRGPRLERVLTAGGVCVLLATPILERFDLLVPGTGNYWMVVSIWLLAALCILGPPIALLGTALPTLLTRYSDPGQWGRLYAVNTLGAVIGSLGAGWVLLPHLGFVPTSWLVGALLGLAGAGLCTRTQQRAVAAALTGVALVVAAVSQSGVGTRRVPSGTAVVKKVLSFSEGPDSQVAVVELSSGSRALLIDGFQATSESPEAHYMAWMGRLPMLLHPAPKEALVICFGTGQTINGVRQEGIERADVVDVNPRVFQNARFFAANQNVLQDPRIHPIVMDGRAWLRRTQQRYDVITLEPMPPHFAGVNALYSREFYELARARLRHGGVIAQWLPYHLIAPQFGASILATFRQVFPNAILWQDPEGDNTDVLLGGLEGPGVPTLGSVWPGLARNAPGRNLTPPQILSGLSLRSGLEMANLAQLGKIVTDDNQLLSYGKAVRAQDANNAENNHIFVDWSRNVALAQEAAALVQANPVPAQIEGLSASLATFAAELQRPNFRPNSWEQIRAARDFLRTQKLVPASPMANLLQRLNRIRPLGVND